MIDFEEIGETFENGLDKVKDFTKKNKVITFAIIGVGAFALYQLFKEKSISQDTEYVSTYAYVPTGYDGYPTMSESVSFDEVVEQVRNETTDINEKFYNETMSDITQIIDKGQVENNEKFETIMESINGFSNNISSGSFIEEKRSREETIEQMKSNSEAWHTASPTERKVLEAENQKLGSELGATFDSASGTWSQDGESLYNVTVKNKTNSSTANLTNVGVTEKTVSKSDTIAQMKANSEAWHTASESERKVLEAENKRLGASIGGTYNSSTGVWSNSDGTKLY